MRNQCSTSTVLIALLFSLASIVGCSKKPSLSNAFEPQCGDLIFQDVDGGKLCDAIEAVTEGYGNTCMSHVGMIVSARPNAVQIIEAGGKGVHISNLDDFLARSHDAAGRPKTIVGRLKPAYQPLIPTAISFAMGQQGKPYDKFFRIAPDAYYCSELVYDAFRHANNDQPLFAAAPMTFKDPTTNEFFPAWKDYFAKLDTPIPEGEPGVNPGAMSRDACLDIVHVYGELSRKSYKP